MFTAEKVIAVFTVTAVIVKKVAQLKITDLIK